MPLDRSKLPHWLLDARATAVKRKAIPKQNRRTVRSTLAALDHITATTGRSWTTQVGQLSCCGIDYLVAEIRVISPSIKRDLQSFTELIGGGFIVFERSDSFVIVISNSKSLLDNFDRGCSIAEF